MDGIGRAVSVSLGKDRLGMLKFTSFVLCHASHHECHYPVRQHRYGQLRPLQSSQCLHRRVHDFITVSFIGYGWPQRHASFIDLGHDKFHIHLRLRRIINHSRGPDRRRPHLSLPQPQHRPQTQAMFPHHPPEP